MGQLLNRPPVQKTLFMLALALAGFATTLNSSCLAANASGAEVLFNAGRQALEDENYELACQKFVESNRLERAAGTLLNIGNCEEKLGRVATAWARYTEAMDMLGPDDPRFQFAKDNAEGIEARVPRLTVTVSKDSPPKTAVTRNGTEWTEPLGTPLRLDPQSYVIRVDAPNHESATYEVTLEEGDIEELTVRPGKRLRASSSVPPKRQRAGFIIGGAGAATAVAAAIFGVLTYVEYQKVRDACDYKAETCYTQEGSDAAARGATFEILAYSLGAVGVTGLTVGAYLLLHQKKGQSVMLEAGQLGNQSLLRVRSTF